jgi:hypothetical protein
MTGSFAAAGTPSNFGAKVAAGVASGVPLGVAVGIGVNLTVGDGAAAGAAQAERRQPARTIAVDLSGNITSIVFNHRAAVATHCTHMRCKRDGPET